jgi:NAD-dependent deacetylase
MIITQNIDALHQRAGSSAVVELHGSYQTLTCLGCCQQTQASSDLLDAFINQGGIPRCPQCGNPLKPDVILFGEQLPVEKWHQARDAAKHCDLMLVLGSSMTTAPACNLPLIAANSGAKLIMINKTATPLDPNADIVIPGDTAEILPDIEKRVLTNE